MNHFRQNILFIATFLLIVVPVKGSNMSNASKKNKKLTEPLTTQAESKKKSPLDTDYKNLFTAVAPEIPDEVSFCGQKVDLRKSDMRERFDREMIAMMYMHTSSLILLKRANRYFPVIEPILKANDMPDDLKYLACIESTLNPKAVSAARAVGMWQFMPETAKQFGLEVTDDVDERYHIEKETQAACLYLKDAYSRYGDWATAAASYNTGTSRISKELVRQGVSSSFDLWLVEETARYVFRILACKEFMTDPKKYGYFLTKDQLYQPIAYRDTIITGKVENWVTFAKEQGINYYDLKANNLWIRNDSLPNIEMKSYKISIPLKESLNFDKMKISVHQKNWVIDEN
jgi:membrane-bound lytic murein transglycosylase D